MQAFSGIKVLDLTHVLAGPFCAYQLALLGADVTKVENPHAPDQSRENGPDHLLNEAMMGIAYLAQGANKRAITLDLRHPRARDILFALVRDADVLIENYRPGALEALGLGYKALSGINPRLVYCSISAFGHSGPRREQTAYDIVIQATSGLMKMNGDPETGPRRLGGPMIDYSTGMTAAFAVSAALHERERTGRGLHVDLAMFDVARLMVSSSIVGAMHGGKPPGGTGNALPFGTQGTFETANGLLMVAANNRRQQKRLWDLLGRPELLSASTAELAANQARDRAVLDTAFRAKSAGDWEEILQAHRVPAARIRGVFEALADPQTAARGQVQPVPVPGRPGETVQILKSAFSFSTQGPEITTPPPVAGADTDAVLRALGLGDQDIEQLRAEGAV